MAIGYLKDSTEYSDKPYNTAHKAAVQLSFKPTIDNLNFLRIYVKELSGCEAMNVELCLYQKINFGLRCVSRHFQKY